MKRLWVAVVAASMLLGVFAFGASAQEPIIIEGDVYLAAGGPGDATTENSFASAAYYKCNDPSELPLLQPDVSDADGVIPANFFLGTNWANSTDGLDIEVMVALETMRNMNGWADVNYTTSTFDVIPDDTNPLWTMPDSFIQPYPSVTLMGGFDWIRASFTATPPPNFLQYDVYRTQSFPGETFLGPAVDLGGGNYEFNDTGLAPGSYYYMVGITYSCANFAHTTVGRSEPQLETTLADTVPPTISAVQLNGAATQTYPLSAVPALTLTATVDDTTTGLSAIAGANYTIGAGNWPGLAMAPTDGAFDTATETVDATLANPATTGTWDYCVYGWDAVPNYNTTSTECATLTITDDVAPAVLNVAVDPIAVTSGGQVWINATIDDTGLGDSFIANASYEVIGQVASTPMAAVDGTFSDNIVEPVTSNFLTTGWADAIYDVCVYGADTPGNVNTGPNCAPLTVSPDGLPPLVTAVQLDGQAPLMVDFSALPGTITLTANVDDSTTGGSNINNATWTVDGVFSGTDMTAVDGAYDSPTEDVTATLIPPATAGNYNICVVAYDSWLNSGTACTTLMINDDVPPAITATLNQLSSLTIPVLTPTVSLNATLDDSAAGGSIVTNASYDTDWGDFGAMAPVSPAADVRDFESTLVTGALGIGTYQVCVYGADSAPNLAGPSCLSLTVSGALDTTAPEIFAVAFDLNPIFVSSLPGTVTLSAIVDDTNTGGSSIGGANYTTPAANWPGTAMVAVDGSYDSVNESVSATIVPPSAAGTYQYCVYGSDSWPNDNTVGQCTDLVVVDDAPPAVTNVALDTTSIQASAPPATITITADVDDSAAGNSVIANATFTVAGGPSTNLAAGDGAFDSPTEAVTGTFDPASLGAGGHSICVYAADSAGNVNLGPNCATLTVVDDVDPVAVISLDPDPANVNDVVTLNGSGSSDTHGAVTSWAWTILDSASALVATYTGATASHTFTTADTYTINLVVMDDSGNSGSVDATLVVSAPTPPNAPTNLQVNTGTELGELELTWTASTTPGVLYNVYRSATETGTYSMIAGAVSGTSYTNTGLQDDTTYWYKVTAVNADGESDFSNAASAKTRAPAQPGLPDWIWILLILIIVIIVIVILAAMRRRPAEAPPVEEAPAVVEEEPVAEPEEEVFMCPRCGASVSASAAECPSCGALFEEEETAEAEEAYEEEAEEAYEEEEEEGFEEE